QQPIYALSLATESMALRRSDVVSTEALNQMQSAVFAADELLSSLAMQVRLDRDDLRPDMEAFSVQDMLERIDALFATRAQKHGLRWRVLPSLCEVRSNPLLLERMVCNLVSNAMRYTPEGGVLLSCRVRSGHLLIQIWDTGPGIPVHEQSTIFEAHYRGSAAQSHDRGLGLGLSIVSRCAALLDVRVGLKSVPGRGSCFALWVPLANPP
ncbi:HAMP domain-containing sensor histidine kinase, partial [Hydrogenophaga sp.]|uniref:sensor histidine kinase n=1 Tax=Hydrogenophaga sp. TaxID=1904254 RepID=UPI002731EFFC